MKLKNQVTIQPPPYSDNSGKIINPNSITLDNIDLIFIDNPKNKTLNVQILPLSVTTSLWSGNDYTLIGDWTKSQAEQKLEELMGDDQAKYLRLLYPKTLEENPTHPGTQLSKMIKSVGIQMTDSCSCKRHAL
jgi:hypothetical protein